MKIRWHIIGLIALIWFDILFVWAILIAASIEEKGIGYGCGDGPNQSSFSYDE